MSQPSCYNFIHILTLFYMCQVLAYDRTPTLRSLRQEAGWWLKWKMHTKSMSQVRFKPMTTALAPLCKAIRSATYRFFKNSNLNNCNKSIHCHHHSSMFRGVRISMLFTSFNHMHCYNYTSSLKCEKKKENANTLKLYEVLKKHNLFIRHKCRRNCGTW
jgi:hypothetical protein